jgi:hypothetical protein
MTSIDAAFDQSTTIIGPRLYFGVGSWNPGAARNLPTDVISLTVYRRHGIELFSGSSTTRIRDPWVTTEYSRTTTNGAVDRRLLRLSDLGWSQDEAAEVRMRLIQFEDDWDSPGMEAYDAL